MARVKLIGGDGKVIREVGMATPRRAGEPDKWLKEAVKALKIVMIVGKTNLQHIDEDSIVYEFSEGSGWLHIDRKANALAT